MDGLVSGLLHKSGLEGLSLEAFGFQGFLRSDVWPGAADSCQRSFEPQPGRLQDRLPDGSWRPVSELTYQPLVLEAQGGYAKDASALLHRLAAVVAAVEGADCSAVHGRLFEQLAVAVGPAATPLLCLRRVCASVLLSLKLSHEAECESPGRLTAELSFSSPARCNLPGLPCEQGSAWSPSRLYSVFFSPLKGVFFPGFDARLGGPGGFIMFFGSPATRLSLIAVAIGCGTCFAAM